MTGIHPSQPTSGSGVVRPEAGEGRVAALGPDSGGALATAIDRRSAPDRLGWLYVLVLASLLSVGVNAGGLAFIADRSFSQPWAVAVDVCVRTYPGHGVAELAARDRCLAPQFRRRGLVMLAGAGMALAGAAGLILVVPLVDRRRLRRRLTVPGAPERFAELCDRAGLTGRHRPRLVVAGPPVRQAYTTGAFTGAPTVVLPAAVAVAHADPARFDPVVAHELAHVLARDVNWVSAVRGLVWLPVPVVFAAGLLELVYFGLDSVYLTALGRAAVIAVLTAILAAGLLRRREREADRYAADAGHSERLVALLASAPLTRRRGLLARHPDPASRVAALTRPAARPPAGFSHGLTVGAVAMLAMGSADALARDLFLAVQASVGPPVAVWVAAALLAVGLLPALTRRAATGAGGWWRPILGTATGFAVAGLVATGLPVPGSPGVPQGADAQVALLAAALAGLLAAAAAGLCAVLARLVVTQRPASAGWRRGTGLVAASAAVAVLWPLPAVASVLPDASMARAWLVFALPRSGWPLLALLVPVLAGLLTLRGGGGRPGAGDVDRGGGGGRRWDQTAMAAVAITVLVGGTAMVGRAVMSPPGTLAEANRQAQQRGLLCVLAGWVVLVALAVGRRHGVARALIAGWLAAAATALVPYLHAVANGRAAGLDGVEAHLLPPLVWSGYLVAFTAPFLVGRPPLPDLAAPAAARSPMVAVTALLAPLAVLVLGPGIPGGYAPLPPAQPTGGSPTAPPVAPGVSATPGPAASGSERPDPGRPLSRAQARRAATAVGTVLPRGWTTRPVTEGGDDHRIDPPACRPLAEDAYLDQLGAGQRVREQARYATAPGPAGIASTEVVVEVRSHAMPVDPSVFAEAEAARRACPGFTVGGGSGSPIRFTVRASTPPALGEQSWQVDYGLATGSGPTRITGRSSFLIVRVGHNLVTLYVTAVLEPLDEKLVTKMVGAAVAALDG